jgi:hypothetical protein
MAGYTPVFSSIYDGTLCGKWPTAVLWASLLPLIDARGEIRMSYEAIAARTGWPMELLRQGIHDLMQPDPDSQSAAEEGRRLVLLDPSKSWGWRAVNHGLYREKARKLSYDSARTASGRDAERKRESREVPTRPAKSREVPLSDSNANTDSERRDSSALPTSTRKSFSPISGTDDLQNRVEKRRPIQALAKSLAQAKRVPR